VDGVVSEDELWACTTCGSCEEVCPVRIEPIDKIIAMRRNLVLMESRFPSEVQLVFRNMENNMAHLFIPGPTDVIPTYWRRKRRP
jgi:Fe-S oxidoreductase